MISSQTARQNEYNEAVKKIPKGHVATYGKVAEMAGNAKMSRAVGNALHKIRTRNIFRVSEPGMRRENLQGHLRLAENKRRQNFLKRME